MTTLKLVQQARQTIVQYGCTENPKWSAGLEPSTWLEICGEKKPLMCPSALLLNRASVDVLESCLNYIFKYTLNYTRMARKKEAEILLLNN